MELWTLFALLCLLAVSQGQDDPCSDYLDLGDPVRSTAHGLPVWQTPICDDYTVVESKWMRFKQYNGEKLSESCVEMNNCGTQAPIWMDGTHPTGYIEKNTSACMSAQENCCYERRDITVRRCQNTGGKPDYFIYKLANFGIGCSSGYCAGDKPPCPRDSIFNTTLQRCTCYKPYPCPIDPSTELPKLDAIGSINQLTGEEQDLTLSGSGIYETNLMCKITYYTKSGDTVTEGAVTKAPGVFHNFYSATCRLPALPVKPAGVTEHGWHVLLSNNGGASYSEAVDATVASGSCLICDAQDQCSIRTGFCFINYECYAADELKDDHACLSCKPSVSTSLWTTLSENCQPHCSLNSECVLTTQHIGQSTSPSASTTTSTSTKSASTSTTTGTTSSIPTSTTTSSAGGSGIGGSSTPAPPVGESWGEWGECSKPVCDNGYRNRTRGVDVKQGLCSTKNCKEEVSEYQKGTIIVFGAEPNVDMTMLQVVLAEEWMLQIIVDDLNEVCSKNLSRCCISGIAKLVGGNPTFTIVDEMKVAAGFPRVYSSSNAIGWKIKTTLNKESQELVCHQNTRKRRGVSDHDSNMDLSGDVLAEAINQVIPIIHQERGLNVKAYILPGDHSTPSPTDEPEGEHEGGLSIGIIALIALVGVAILAGVAVAVYCAASKNKQNRIAQPMDKYLTDSCPGSPYSADPTAKPTNLDYVYDDAITTQVNNMKNGTGMEGDAPPEYSSIADSPNRDSLCYDVIPGDRSSNAGVSSFGVGESTYYSSLGSDGVEAHTYTGFDRKQ